MKRAGKHHPKKQPRKAHKDCPVGSPEYFRTMPAEQAREEALVHWHNLQRARRELSEIRSALSIFRSLLNDGQ
jgi:queuine/archaeosine tRNA-ribosyltransferase